MTQVLKTFGTRWLILFLAVIAMMFLFIKFALFLVAAATWKLLVTGAAIALLAAPFTMKWKNKP